MSKTEKNISYWSNGKKRIEETLKDGLPDGLTTEWYENGQKKQEVTFKDGIPDGLTTWWHWNGTKKLEGTWKDGEIISVKVLG
jgi:antitoxin component YwqK of YwqJK toxin-antitoxin module